MIQLAVILEDEYRRIRKMNEQIEERERQAYTKITEAVAMIEGTGGYPDATFTLRLAFGDCERIRARRETHPTLHRFRRRLSSCGRPCGAAGL